MSRLHGLRLFVSQRLTAAVDEIFGQFERTITEYEEELDRRHRKVLGAVLAPEMKLRKTDIQQLSVSNEKVPLERQEWKSNVDQEDPDLTYIKEEQEEPWIHQERHQLQEVEEVKYEDQAQRQTGRMEIEADGEDCGGPEPARSSDPLRRLQSVNDGVLSGADSEVSDDDCKQSREFKSLSHAPVGDKSFVCCECGRKFGRKDSLRRHMRFHTGEKPYSCSVCGKRFSQRPNLIRHMRCHSGEKPFSCSFCDTSFAVRSALVNHMRIHTGEKPFSCLYCEKSFTQKGGLKKHMTVHTGEKPYSCPVCDKSFSQKANLTYHFSVHTGQKQFSCSVCDKRFTWQSQVKSHKCVGETSSSN